MFCVHCGKKFKDESVLKKHRPTCKKSPVEIAKKQFMDFKVISDAAFETIRITSKDITEVVTGIVDFYHLHGIEVSFTDYPTAWSNTVSNSHNAPKGKPQNWHRTAGTPTGYPGWQGKWKGTIVNNSSLFYESLLYFNDIMPYYINKGSGGGGDNFRYEGILFVEDFPLMYKEYELNGGVAEEHAKLFNAQVEKLAAARRHSVKEALDKNPTLKEVENLVYKTTDLANELCDVINNIKARVRKDFEEDNPFAVPKIESAFVDVSKLNEMKKHIENAKTNKAASKETASSIRDLERLFNNLNKYYKDHVELFI
jgi:hypothetical protein